MSKSTLSTVCCTTLALALAGCSNSQQLPQARESAGLFSPTSFTTPAPGLDLKVTDFSGDAKTDLVVPLLGGGIALLKNQSGTGVINFVTASHNTPGRQISDAIVGDMDGDTRPDLVASFNDKTVELLLQSVTGSFDSARLLPDVDAGSILLDTVNSDDSTLDIILSDQDSGKLGAIWFNDSFQPLLGGIPSTIEFSEDFPTGSGFGQSLLTDLDGNGLKDVLVIDAGRSKVSVHLHVPQPLKPTELIDPDTGEHIPAPQDRSYPTYTTVYGSSSIEDLVGGRPLRLATGDLNGDNFGDVAVLTEFVDNPILPNPVVVNPPLPVATSSLPSHLVMLYQTNVMVDGNLPGSMRSAGFLFRSALAFPAWVHDISMADLDKDGKLDIIGCGEGGASNYLFVYPGLGNFTFGNPKFWGLTFPPLRIGVADFDGDTYPDIAVLMPTSNAISVFRNDSNSGQGNQGIGLTQTLFNF